MGKFPSSKKQKNYMGKQTYIFLQKLKCPKSDRILACGASYKIKVDKWYYYYKETEKIDIGLLQSNEGLIRVFPLQKDNNW